MEAPKSVPEWARKPLLGFSTWSTQLLDNIPGYGGKHIQPWFNEKEIKSVSDAMKLKLPLFEYINLDSGWCNGCDEYGRWIYRNDLFPNGLKTVSEHLKQNGHKLGVYMLPGIRQDALKCKIKGTNRTVETLVTERKQGCGFNGSTYMPDRHDEYTEKYYASIAELFVEYGISYVKLDGVGPGGGSEYYPFTSPDTRACLLMLHHCFRKYDIWVELSWYMDPALSDEWAYLSNGARIFVDIESYSARTMTSSHRVLQRITPCEKWSNTLVVGKHNGFYVDLDAVLIGMTVDGICVDGLDNDDVRQTYVSFWALVSSVFCIGADPRALPEKYLSMLNHKEMMEINQSGIMARPIGSGDAWNNRKQVWWKQLDDGRVYVCLINSHTYMFMLGLSHEVAFEFKDVNMPTKVKLKDVWTGENLGVHDTRYSIVLRAGQSQTLLVTPA